MKCCKDPECPDNVNPCKDIITENTRLRKSYIDFEEQPVTVKVMRLRSKEGEVIGYSLFNPSLEPEWEAHRGLFPGRLVGVFNLEDFGVTTSPFQSVMKGLFNEN